MDFMAGGELFKHLNDQKIMSEDDVRVYAAEILLAIEYLHALGVVHR